METFSGQSFFISVFLLFSCDFALVVFTFRRCRLHLFAPPTGMLALRAALVVRCFACVALLAGLALLHLVCLIVFGLVSGLQQRQNVLPRKRYRLAPCTGPMRYSYMVVYRLLHQ